MAKAKAAGKKTEATVKLSAPGTPGRSKSGVSQPVVTPIVAPKLPTAGAARPKTGKPSPEASSKGSAAPSGVRTPRSDSKRVLASSAHGPESASPALEPRAVVSSKVVRHPAVGGAKQPAPETAPLDLAFFRRELQRFVQQCNTELLQLKDTLAGHITGDDADISQVIQAQHRALQQQEKIKRQLREIESAMKRIDEGDFGICEETGDDIEPARLRAIPWTRLSADGAQIRERRMKRFAAGGGAWAGADGGDSLNDEESDEG